jgi:hypothetical protein
MPWSKLQLYLPRWRVSPRNTTPMATAMTIESGLNIATYTAPFIRSTYA